MQNFESQKGGCLVVFDFDKTIIKDDTYTELFNLVTVDWEDPEKNQGSSGEDWFEYNRTLCDKLKQSGYNCKTLKDKIQSLEFNEHMKDIFDFLKENKNQYNCIIISGAMKIIIEWILEYNGFNDLFSHIYANSGYIGEDNCLKFHGTTMKSCGMCSFSICKKEILKEHLEKTKYDKIIYVGDGIIDYCPCTLLEEKDDLFPRKDFPLYQKIFEEDHIRNLKCNVISWDNGKIILESLKK